jgi:uncharacterized protein
VAAVVSFFLPALLTIPSESLSAFLPSGRGSSAAAAALMLRHDYGGVFLYRATHLWARLWPAFFSDQLLALLFVGFIVARSRFFERLETHRALVRRVFFISAALAVAGIVYAALIGRFVNSIPGGWHPYAVALLAFRGYVLAAAYVSAFLILWQSGGWAQRALVALAPIGRMALTCYVAVPILSFVFFGATDTFQQVGAFTGVVTGVLVYAGLLVTAHWWFGQFHLGPLERIWRSATYGRRQAMRCVEAARRLLASPEQGLVN